MDRTLARGFGSTAADAAGQSGRLINASQDSGTTSTRDYWPPRNCPFVTRFVRAKICKKMTPVCQTHLIWHTGERIFLPRRRDALRSHRPAHARLLVFAGLARGLGTE